MLLTVVAHAVAAVVFPPQSANAQDSSDGVPGTECCASLLYPVGARTVALGQALTARGGEDGMFINPATLADLPSTQVIVHRSKIGEDPMTTLSLIVHSKVAGVFALTYRLIDYGSIEATDDEGNPTGRINTFDQVVIASFATTVGRGLTGGVNYRLFNFSNNCDGFCIENPKGGTTHMVDAGLRYAPSFMRELLLGASLLYAGPKLQVNNALQGDFTPTRLRVGAAYEAGNLVTQDSTIAIWLHLDAIQRLHEPGTPGINAGIEVVLDNTIFLRAGHASSADGISYGGNAVGLGLKYERFNVSVAKSVTPSPLFDAPVYVSFGLSF